MENTNATQLQGLNEGLLKGLDTTEAALAEIQSDFLRFFAGYCAF